MENNRDEIVKLKQLLAAEKEYDLQQYQLAQKTQSLNERRANGTCWYPLIIRETGYGLGEYPYLIVERTSFKEVPNRFNGGKLVSLFSNNDYYKGEEVRGTVNYADNDRLKIILTADELPEWASDGKIGVSLLFDEYSYKCMEHALDKVIKADKGRLPYLTDVLLGFKPPVFDNVSKTLSINNLNQSQNKAVEQIINAEDVALVHGPPGTGKTTTLVAAIKIIAEEEKNILVCAPSNAAADLLTEKIAAAGLNVVRIGNLSRIDDAVLSHTVEKLMESHADMKDIRGMRKQADEYRRMASKYKRQFGKEEREQRDALYKEAKLVSHTAAKLEDYIVNQILDNADAIVCTLVGVLNQYLEGRKFKTLIIDEAAQALEPATWIPITLCERVILAGDPFQLPPTVRNPDAEKNGLNITLLEKCMRRMGNANLLQTQYRMNSNIMGFSNQWFYNNQLLAHDSVTNNLLPTFDLQSSVEWIDTAGCGFEEAAEAVSFSLYNPGEADTIVKRLNEAYTLLANFDSISVGVISPYREQVIWLKKQIDPSLYPKFDISIDTIDSFQGQERDMILISLVRSNDKGEIGFLNDYRRMNVAITRAKKQLIVVGDSGTLSNTKFYQSFIEYVEQNGNYRSAWEFI